MALTKVKGSVWDGEDNGQALSVKDYGAVGDGVTDDRPAFVAALAASDYIFVPEGDYVINGTLELSNGHHIQGVGLRGPSDAVTGGVSRLIFSGTATGCIVNAAPAANLKHCSFDNLTIQTTGTYSWIFDFNELLGTVFQNVSARNNSLTGGVLRSAKLLTANPSWVNQIINCGFRIDDTSTEYIVDVDWSDSSFTTSHFTGGKGTIIRTNGGGQNRFVGCQLDRSNSGGAGVTLLRDTENGGTTMFDCCVFDENDTYGVYIDADPIAVAGPITNYDYYNIFNGCVFRNSGATSDIKFNWTQSGTMLGGVIANCIFAVNTVTTEIDIPADWDRIHISGNHFDDTAFFDTDLQGADDPNFWCNWQGINLPNGGIIAREGSWTVLGQDNVAGFFGTAGAGTAGAVLGSLSGTTPFVGASQTGAAASADLAFTTDGTARLKLDKDGVNFRPQTDDDIALGSATFAYKGVYSHSHYSIPLTFATLPGTPTQGQSCYITDSNTAVFNAAAAGGGANVVKVHYNGTAWVVG